MTTVTIIQPTISEEQNHKLRCAAYCRVSSNSEDQLNSFMAQTRYYEKAFEKSDREQLVDIYADEGITGTREDKRDEFQRMISDCRKGKIDRIYTKSISRFARNTKDCLKNIRELKSLGITVFFEKENIDTAKLTDEMMITIMGGLAQEESTSISQNMRWSVQKRMENGTFNPPSLPYGYMRRKQDIVTIENEAKIVRDIFTQYINGIGMETIAKELNKKHIDKGSKGFIWCKNTIRYILMNEKYTGRSVFRKFYTTDNFPFKQKENKGEFDQYLVQETMPVIISEDIFEKAQHLISIRKSMGCRETAKYPLSGKIKCGNCGSSFRRKKINNTVCWTCSKHNINAADCELKAIPQDLIYSIFIGLCNKLFCNYKTILKPLQTSLQGLKLKEFTGKTQVMDIHKEIAKFREQTHILARLKTKGFLDEAKYIEQTTELTAKINKLQAELKKLTRSDDEDETLDQIEILIDFFEKRDSPMTEFEETAFESIVDKIVVKSQHELEFHLIGGLKFKEKK